MRKTAIWLVAAGLLVACDRDLPTTDHAAEPSSRSISSEQVEQAQLAIDDALARVLPELSFADDTGPLASSLVALQQALNEGPLDDKALARAVTEVRRYEQTTGADPEDLAVIRLALEVVQN